MGFHIVKRKNMEWWKAWLVRIISILLGIMLSAAVTVFLTGKDPVNVFTTMFDGAFGTERRLWSLLQGIAMLLCISLAVTPAFKMRFWNIGAEGQALMGGLASAACMMFIGDRLPNWLMLIVMAVTSMLAGA
ncbi:MAG: ABC transporter permease, partial [Clostridia bacterium]|nr:ABC transporter permease [Clostridia bacterium]